MATCHAPNNLKHGATCDIGGHQAGTVISQPAGDPIIIRQLMFHTQLEKLYHEIHSCHICPNMDSSKALRRTEAIDVSMDVFIVSQALAERQLRESGVNFFTKEGKLGNTGQNLEKFLNQFCRTVYPPRNVRLASGNEVRRKEIPPFLSVYNTELTQCFPGKGSTRGDRAPTATEIATCLKQNFLKREIFLIRPKLILLMGDKTRQAFYKAFSGEVRKDSLGAHIERMIALGRIPMCKIGGVKVSVLPIQHASGANPYFYRMLNNATLIRLIRGLLAQS